MVSCLKKGQWKLEATGASAADFGYGRALSMGINALPMVQKGLSSSSKLYRWPAKAINWLSSPGAAEVELGSSVGANVLPAVVNLQYPGEEASGWDKALYYGGNTGLSLAGGLTGGLIAAGKNMAKAGLQGAKQAVKEADVPSPETIYRQGLENTTALDTVLKGQDGIGGISPLPNPAQSDILNYQTITGGLNGAGKSEPLRYQGTKWGVTDAGLGEGITGPWSYSGRGRRVGLEIPGSNGMGSQNSEVLQSARRTMAVHEARRGVLTGDNRLGDGARGTYIRGSLRRDNAGREIGNTWSPSETLKNEYTKAGLPAPEFIELPPTQEAARRFRNSIINAKKSLGAKGASVDVHKVNEYQNMRLFLAKDRLSGVAVKPDGTIVSVFARKGAPHNSADALMEVAISAGGNKLDAYDTFLPKIYARHGFKVTDRLTWDDQFAPDDWSYDFFKDFNGGRPDVVMMEYDPMYFGEYARPGTTQMPEVPEATAGQAAWVSEAAAPTPIQTENTSSLLPGEELTPSRLTTKERLAQNPNLTAGQRQAAEGLGEYAVLHNDALIRQSVLDISANPSEVLGRLRDKISTGQRFDALDFEQSRQMVIHFYSFD